MITKEQLRNTSLQVYQKLNILYSDLEDLWSWAMEKGYGELANAADSAQHSFVSHTSVSDVRDSIESLVDDMYTILEENEKAKDLDRLMRLEKNVGEMRETMRRIDRILDVNEMIARSERERSEEEEEDE